MTAKPLARPPNVSATRSLSCTLTDTSCPLAPLHSLHGDFQPTIPWQTRDEAVVDLHALRSRRSRQLCACTVSEEHGRGQAHLHPAQVQSEALAGAMAKWTERKALCLREASEPACVIESAES